MGDLSWEIVAMVISVIALGFEHVRARRVDDAMIFASDFGPRGLRRLRNEIVEAAKAHTCHGCGGEIQRGQRHRQLVEASDEGLGSYRWCQGCLHTELTLGQSEVCT